MPFPFAIEPSTTREGRFETISTVGGETAKAFVPPVFPPRDKPVRTETLAREHERAAVALGRLESAAQIVPEREVLWRSYADKEAVVSSQIEGTQFSMQDVLQTNPHAATAKGLRQELQEISNYVTAMEYGLQQIKALPISTRAICNIHSRLLVTTERGALRRSQNWIGGSRPGNALFVPPSPLRLPDLMSELEKFIHQDARLPHLFKAGMLHAQFETIHPFLDGNGRTGRMLIVLYFQSQGILKESFLYPSLYFKKHRTRYYECLQKVREQGAWEEWLGFFFAAIEDTANDCSDTLTRLFYLFDEDEERIKREPRSQKVLAVHRLLKRTPIVARAKVLELGMSAPTAQLALQKLERLKIVEREKLGRRIFYKYKGYCDLLLKDTEPLPL